MFVIFFHELSHRQVDRKDNGEPPHFLSFVDGQSAVDGLGGAAGDGHGVSEGWGLRRWWWWWWWGGGVALRGRDLWLLSGADGDEPGAVDAAGLEAPGGESEGGRGDGLGG